MLNRTADSQSTVRWTLAGLLALTLVLYGRELTTNGLWYGDSANHLLNGIFLRDAILHARQAISDPMAFAVDYYSKFPGVTLGYHPPVFPVIEAFFMLLFGVSTASGQMTMLAMELLMCAACFAWMRRLIDLPQAALGTAILTATPLLLFWGQCISLEIPALAFLLAAAWAFERAVETPGNTWRYSILFSGSLALAIWTKQHALFLVPVFGIALFLRGRGRILLSAPGMAATGIVAAAVVGILFLTSMFGDALSQAGMADVEYLGKRLVGSFWTYYLQKLPHILGWPLLVSAGAGLFLSIAAKDKRMWVVWGWLAFFYLSHSYPYPHAMRYTCLWAPPLCVLAVYGISRLPGGLPWIAGRTVRCSTLVLGGVTLYTVYVGLGTSTPRWHTPLEEATKIASQRVGRYSCLTRVYAPPRGAAYFRVASESVRLDGKATLDNSGRLLRAAQILPRTDCKELSVLEFDDRLREWNVKMILFEYTGDQLPINANNPLTRLLAELVSSEDFRLVQQYDNSVPINDTWRTLRHSMWEPLPAPKRTLALYERIADLPWNPSGGPSIHPGRAANIVINSGD